jgi:hypothetical protein
MKTKIAIKYDPDNWKEIKKAVDYLRGKGFKVEKRKDATKEGNDSGYLSSCRSCGGKWLSGGFEYTRWEDTPHNCDFNTIHLPQDWKKFVDLIEAELEPEPEFKAGDWVIYDKYVFRINKVESGIASSDDTIKCKWTLYIGTEYLRHATPEEIKSALIEEAKRRYKNKRFYAASNIYYECDFDSIKEFKYIENNDGLYVMGDFDGLYIYYRGKWAEIIQDEPDYKRMYEEQKKKNEEYIKQAKKLISELEALLNENN